MRSNDYSDTWFATFLASLPQEQTDAEVQFLVRQFPRPAFSALLDICCGPGRHVLPLAGMGYDITGLDNNEKAILAAEKKRGALHGNFVLGDQRTHALPEASFHGIFVLWQSFGFFTPMENRRLLEKWHSLLKPGGRLVLDVYNREFFEGRDGERVAKTAAGDVTETKKLRGSQLSVHLEYPGGKTDDFHWEIFTPQSLITLAAECGFSLVCSCTGFDETQPVNFDKPRMQLVFQR